MSRAERGFLIIKPHAFHVEERYLDLNLNPLLTKEGGVLRHIE
jgi:hypothetical protein